MSRIEELVAKKREVFNWYLEEFSEIDEIKLNPEPEYTRNSYWMPTIIFDDSLDIDVIELIEYMQNLNMDIRNFFYPNSMFPMFEEVKDNKVAYSIYSRGVNLPNYFEMKREDIALISGEIKKYLGIDK